MKVIACIGTGAFGKVYKVEVQGQVFALKKVPLLSPRFPWSLTAKMIVPISSAF